MAANEVEGSNSGQLVKQKQTLNDIMEFNQQVFAPIEKKEEETITQKVFSNWSSQQQYGSDGAMVYKDFAN